MENTSEDILNGDPKKDTDCDISSSDNTKVVTNGINSDSDETKSTKSDEGHDVVIPAVCPMKASEGKQMSEKKKENKKIKVTEKSSDQDKKKESGKNNNKSTETKRENDKPKAVEVTTDKTNGEVNKMVNGDKDRESTPSEDGDEKKRDAEVVFIQDMGFTVKIVSPGAEPLDIQVSSKSW